MDPALAASLLQGTNPVPQPNASAAPPAQSFNNTPNPSYSQSNASSQPASNQFTPSTSNQQTPAPSTTTSSSPQSNTFNMNLGGPGGISMSSGPSGNHTSLGGPNGINISHGPNGNYTSLGGPSGINFQGGLFGDSDDDSFWQTGINNNNTFFGTGNTINGLPFPGISINSNNNMNNVPGGNNVYGANYGNNNGNNWGAVHPSLWPDHVRKNYEEGMAAGQRAMDEAFSTMSGMGMGPWGMGGWPRPPKQKKKKGSKWRK